MRNPGNSDHGKRTGHFGFTHRRRRYFAGELPCKPDGGLSPDVGVYVGGFVFGDGMKDGLFIQTKKPGCLQENLLYKRFNIERAGTKDSMWCDHDRSVFMEFT